MKIKTVWLEKGSFIINACSEESAKELIEVLRSHGIAALPWRYPWLVVLVGGEAHA